MVEAVAALVSSGPRQRRSVLRCAEPTPSRLPVGAAHEVACYLYEAEPAPVA